MCRYDILTYILHEIIQIYVIAVNILAGGFTYFLFSSLLGGEMIQFDEHFSDGLKPPTSIPHLNPIWETGDDYEDSQGYMLYRSTSWLP